MAKQMKVNVPMDQLKDRVCECGGQLFISAVGLKELPALYSPSGQVESAVIPVGFVCCGCGAFMSLRPEEPKKKESMIILAGGQ